MHRMLRDRIEPAAMPAETAEQRQAVGDVLDPHLVGARIERPKRDAGMHLDPVPDSGVRGCLGDRRLSGRTHSPASVRLSKMPGISTAMARNCAGVREIPCLRRFHSSKSSCHRTRVLTCVCPLNSSIESLISLPGRLGIEATAASFTSMVRCCTDVISGRRPVGGGRRKGPSSACRS